MIQNIHFQTTHTQHRLSSRRISEDTLKSGSYNTDAIANASFSIWGSVDSFVKPPITDFAMEHLYYLEDFNLFHYGCGSYTERRHFQSFLIGYTYSGEGSLIYRNQAFPLEAGMGFFIDCRDYHRYEALSPQWDVGILHLGGILLPHFHAHYMQYESPIFEEAPSGAFQQYLEEMLSLYSTPHPSRDWNVSSCIDALLNHVLKLRTVQSARTQQFPENILYLVKYMENHYTHPLTLDYLSSFSGLSKYYLSREFKKYTGFSPNDYLITLRINQAKSLLKNTSLPASKIAHEVGIHDLNNFTNLFRRKTGMTPTQYRRQLSMPE